MRRLPLTVMLLGVSSATRSGGQRPVLDGAIVAERAYRLPPWNGLDAAQRRELQRSTTVAEYERVRRDPQYRIRKVEYGSDGLRVVAYVYQ